MSLYFQPSQSQKRSEIESSQVRSDNLAHRLSERLKLQEPFSQGSPMSFEPSMSQEHKSGRFSIGAKMAPKSYCFETPPSQPSSQYSSASQQQFYGTKPITSFQPFETSSQQSGISSRQMGEFEKMDALKQHILDETMKDASIPRVDLKK